MFKHLQILTMRASFTAKDEGRLPPYLGSTLRGLLGHSMREFCCGTPKVRCHQCPSSKDCAYARCFCSPGNEGGAVNPFVLHPRVSDKTEWKEGESCSFDLTLIGSVAEQAGLFLDALQAMGERGWGAARIPFELEQVIDPMRNRLIFAGGKTWLRNMKAFSLADEERSAGTALIKFDAPVRILIEKKLCQSVPFDVLVQSVSRRISLLSQAYTDNLVQWDEEEMLSAARAVKVRNENWKFIDFKRYSMSHREKSLSLPAISGWALYEGDLTPFVSLLEMGSLLHAGKNATIGFGHYDVVWDR